MQKGFRVLITVALVYIIFYVFCLPKFQTLNNNNVIQPPFPLLYRPIHELTAYRDKGLHDFVGMVSTSAIMRT